MSGIKINLLKDRRVLSEKEYAQERNWLRVSVLVLTITVFVVIAVFLWNLMLTNRLGGIEASIAKASKELAGLAEANAEQIYIKNRLQLISGFLTERQVTREALQQVLTLAIPGVTIAGITYENEGEIGVNVKADNVEALAQAIAYYQTENVFFSQAVSRGINRDKEGMYNMEVGMKIPIGAE